jgi:hypothetical protein
MTETVGQTIDADIAALKAKVDALEAAGKTDLAKVKAWVSANWPHFVTWASGAYVAVKLGVLKLV